MNKVIKTEQTIEQKRLKILITNKLVSLLLLILSILVVFFAFDQTDAESYKPLVFAVFDFTNLNIIYFLAVAVVLLIVGKTIILIFNTVMTLKNRREHVPTEITSMVISILIIATSLLLELIPSSTFKLSGLALLTIFIILVIIEGCYLFTIAAVNNSRFSLSKKHWIIGILLSYICAGVIYGSSIFLALMTLPYYLQPIMTFNSLLFGVISTTVGSYFVSRIIKADSKTMILVLVSTFIITICVFTFSFFGVRYFEYANDITMFLGLLAAPSFVCSALLKIYRYKENQ